MALDKNLIAELLKKADTTGRDVEHLTDGQKKIENYVIGIAIVSAISVVTLLVAVAAIFIDALNFRSSTYQTLIDKVSSVDQKLDSQETLYVSKINSLDEKFEILRQRNPYLK